MKMTIDKFNERVSKFLWQVVIPDTSDWRTKGALGAMERLGVFRITDKNCDTLKFLRIVDEDGNVDIEQLKVGINGALEAGGGSISTGGLIPVNIPKPVLDKLYKFLETETVE